MWEDLDIEIGRVKENTTQTVKFKYDGKVPSDFEITKLEASCGCTTPTFDKNTGYLTAIYNTKAVPQHLRYKNEYTTVKKIIAQTTEGEFVFTFKATVYIKE